MHNLYIKQAQLQLSDYVYWRKINDASVRIDADSPPTYRHMKRNKKKLQQQDGAFVSRALPGNQ